TPAAAAPDPPASITVGGSGECPARGAVARALAALLPEMRVTPGEAGAGGLLVTVGDEGERYRIRIGEVERLLTDAARRCDDRAHAAAVVIALLVNPAVAGAATATDAGAATTSGAATGGAATRGAATGGAATGG